MNLFRSKITTRIGTNTTNRSRLRGVFVVVPLLLTCFALSQSAEATDLDSALSGGNTADGHGVLVLVTTGKFNSGFGDGVLLNNISGSSNTASGFEALYNNISGSYNTATGYEALLSNAGGAGGRGSYNTATGYDALRQNISGVNNVATGAYALYGNTGNYNTAMGTQALNSNTAGSYNTAAGNAALYHSTASNNLAVGYSAGYRLTTGGNDIDIGNLGVAAEANTIRIGNPVATLYPDGVTRAAQTATYIAGISGKAVASGATVLIGSDGHLGTIVSSARFKDEIKPMDKASEAILAFKPVTFHYKKEIDPEGVPQFGLVAEDVARVNPDLVLHDSDGKVYTVRYDAVNAMLLNEFLKEHRTVQEQQKEIDALEAELKEQRALIQKVSAQIELTKPAPQTVLNQ